MSRTRPHLRRRTTWRGLPSASVGLVAVLLAALALGAACSPADDPEPTLPELDFEPVATVVVDEGGFVPDHLEITAGQSIELVNEGELPHSFVATSPARNTGELLPGEVVLLRFDEPDEVEAHDGTDPEQTITIEVTERPEG